MILGGHASDASGSPHEGLHATLDELFRMTAARRPDAIALIDPPNRAAFTDGAPRSLTYAQADRIVSAIAARLRRMGLPTDAVVAVQLPNSVEAVLTLLGVLRAGLIAAPLPLLWRHADCIAALNRVAAKALVTCRRVGATEHGALAMRVAAEVFSIRYVCGFGRGLPEGVVPFDNLFDGDRNEIVAPVERKSDPAAHLAVVTFDCDRDGLVPMARSHRQILAGGLGPLLESAARRDATMLSTIPLGSFAGLTLSLVPWLLSGGTLVLHASFASAVLAGQFRDHQIELAILPGPLLPRLVEAGILAAPHRIKTLLSVWRAPERLQDAPLWDSRETDLVDVSVFGEIGLIAARRGADGRPAHLPAGAVNAPRGAAAAIAVCEILRSDGGTLGMRGAMVPRHPFPPGAVRKQRGKENSADDGTADTGFFCRIDPVSRAIVVTGPPVGIANVGGYRFSLNDLQQVVRGIDAAATIAALPDALAGQRLAGSAKDSAALRQKLDALGVNPLIVRAFRERVSVTRPRT